MNQLVVTRGHGNACVPFELSCRPGHGRLMIEAGTLARPAWRQTAFDAWAAAKSLANREDMDAYLRVDTPNLLDGMSAGVSIGVIALAELLSIKVPAFFATGRVLWPYGFLEGGRAASQKGQYLGDLAARDGVAKTFVVPPLVKSPSFEQVSMVQATDLAAAFVRLQPKGRPIWRQRQRLMPGTLGLGNELADSKGAFIVVVGRRPRLDAAPEGIRLAFIEREGQTPFAFFGGEGHLYWGTSLGLNEVSAEGLVDQWRAAQAAWREVDQFESSQDLPSHES